MPTGFRQWFWASSTGNARRRGRSEHRVTRRAAVAMASGHSGLVRVVMVMTSDPSPACWNVYEALIWAKAPDKQRKF